MITQTSLQALLDYKPESGVFIRKVRTSNRIKVGERAGSFDKAGYLCIRVHGKTYKAHRLAWLYVHGGMPFGEVDHINGDKADNRIENLRDVTKSVNQQNRRSVKGYSRDGNRWKAQIRFGGKWKHLGCYETEQEAHEAYLAAKAEVHTKAREA
jgi:hypothetical protein